MKQQDVRLSPNELQALNEQELDNVTGGAHSVLAWAQILRRGVPADAVNPAIPVAEFDLGSYGF
jgi:hypothetical protein